MKVLDYGGLDHSLAKLKTYLDSRRARDLADADDLCYVDPDEGVSVVIDDPGVTGTVLWGAESANQVALSVNGTSKLLLKAASIAGLESSISTLSGYFVSGSARNALALNGHADSYFATAEGLTALQSVVAGKQDVISDLSTIRTQAGHGETAYGWGNHALVGYVTSVKVGTDTYNPSSGVVSLPAYPTTLPASDVYAWAKAANKPSYVFSEIGSKPSTLAGYGITDAYFMPRTADADKVGIVLGDTVENVLIKHQSLSGYVNNISQTAETDVYLCPDCDYFYDPAIGDPIGGIAAGTAFADLPNEWVCPICGASKEDFTHGGRQFVSGVSKSSGSSTISFTLNRLALRDLSGANNLKAIEYASGSGLLKKNADGTWGFDTNSYLTGITSAMVTGALGYTPFNAANFTQATIKSTLGISDWALAATKPGYAFSELSSKPNTLAGYGIIDAASTSDLLSYLPLSGGTMTGDILFDAGHPMFSFLNGEVEIGSIFFDSTNGLTFSPAVDVEYKFLHTGNTNNITTLGTITTGVWQGSPIAANKLAIDFDWVFVANAGTYDTDDYIHVN